MIRLCIKCQCLLYNIILSDLRVVYKGQGMYKTRGYPYHKYLNNSKRHPLQEFVAFHPVLKKAIPEVLRSEGERPFIFRELRSTGRYF